MEGYGGGDVSGRYGLTYDEVLTHTDCDLTTPASAVQENNGLGTLVSDAFLWADRTLDAAYADSPHTVSVTADGVLRANLPCRRFDRRHGL